MSDEYQYRVHLCGGPRCTPKGLTALHHHLESELWDRELDTVVETHISGCQDYCDYGPNMIVWPGPYRYVGLTSAAITEIIEQHLMRGEPVQHLLARPEMRR